MTRATLDGKEKHLDFQFLISSSERHAPVINRDSVDQSSADSNTAKLVSAANAEWFPNRQPRRTDVNRRLCGEE